MGFFVCLFYLLFDFVVFSRAAPEAYGGPQARGLIRAVAACLRQESATYTTVHGDARSLTH